MILSSDQLQTILNIIDRQHIMLVTSTMGPEMLSKEERDKLTGYGIDYESLYSEAKDPIILNYKLGILSQVMGSHATKTIGFEDLKKFIQSGQNIPLSRREKATINSIKNQSLADIRASKGRIFNDINQVVTEQFASTRANQEAFLRDKITEGVEKRENVKQIARKLGKLTGDWSRNFNKSVQYISHTAFNEGRAALIEKKHNGNEAKVYFQVLVGACQHCITAYLTAGAGSEPKIFTLKEIQANGSNIGRKTKDWKPTLSALHVNCRCVCNEYIEGEEWDGEKFAFPKDKEYTPKRERPKFKVTFNGKDYLV